MSRTRRVAVDARFHWEDGFDEPVTTTLFDGGYVTVDVPYEITLNWGGPVTYYEVTIWARGLVSFGPPTDSQLAFMQSYNDGDNVFAFPGDFVSVGVPSDLSSGSIKVHVQFQSSGTITRYAADGGPYESTEDLLYIDFGNFDAKDYPSDFPEVILSSSAVMVDNAGDAFSPSDGFRIGSAIYNPLGQQSKPASQLIDSTADALNLDGFFSTINNVGALDGFGTPHQLVKAFGNGSKEVYSFHAGAGWTAVFDIDAASNSFDSTIRLVDADGNTVAYNDDSTQLDTGSNSFNDSYMSVVIPADGIYYLIVDSFQSTGVPSSGYYELNVSFLNAPTWYFGFPDLTNAHVFQGGPGDDVLAGSEMADTFYSGGGSDVFTGGGSPDWFHFDQAPVAGKVSTITDFEPGSDRIRLEAADIISYAIEKMSAGSYVLRYVTAAATGVINISIDPAAQISPSDITVVNPDNIGTTIFGTTHDDIIVGLGGDDTLIGGAGADRLFGGFASYLDFYGNGSDTASYQTASARVTADLGNPSNNTGDAQGDQYDSIENLLGTNFDDTLRGDGNDNGLSGGAGDDRLEGAGGNDRLNGGTGTNLLFGGEGNDEMVGGAGMDSFDGGTGDDLVDYSASAAGVTVNLGGGNGIGGDAQGDSYAGIEKLAGSNLVDRLTGNGLDNVLRGNAGDDILDGGDGKDTLFGGDNNDRLTGGAGDDVLNGDGGDDTIVGGAGADQIDGGEGVDLVSYSSSQEGIIIVMRGPPGVGGDAEGDTITNVEKIIGTNYDDYITGDLLDNVMRGGTGDDVLNGGKGNDLLYGEDGADVIYGGDGDDFIRGGADADAINGGAGIDVVDYTASTAIIITLSGGPGIGGEAEGDFLRNVEKVIGSNFGDQITGDGADNVLRGRAGDDTLNGAGGDDVLIGGTGADHLNGGEGIDTVSYDDATSAVTAFLTGIGTTVGDAIGDIYTSIENLTGSSYADRLIGDNGANTISGGDSDDWLTGLGGDDILMGGNGADSLMGGAGADRFEGGAGDDLVSYYYVLTARTYNQAVDGVRDYAVDGRSYGLYLDMADATKSLGEAAGDAFFDIEKVSGTEFADIMLGTNGTDRLYGAFGNDILDGRGGADRLEGGGGDDLYVLDNVSDVVVEDHNQGFDTVRASFSYTLLDDVEGLELAGNGNFNGKGNALDNKLVGNSGVNKLEGLAGRDELDGGAGADTLVGGEGDDSYYVDDMGDKTVELDGQGRDRVFSSVSFSLKGQFVEVLYLSGSANLSATGNSLVNELYGNDGNNSLDGSTGADIMAGGKGDDSYFVDDIGDRVTELANEGTDKVYASVSFSLKGQHIENLTLTGADNISATGNSLANILVGNSGNNVLDGSVGADAMSGGKGNDSYFVDDTGDTVTELFDQGIDKVYASVSFSLKGQYLENLTLTGTGNFWGTGNSLANTIIGNSGANVIEGLGGDDILNGGLGADTLTGGADKDIFLFTSALGGGNIDLIKDYTVADDSIQLDRKIFTALGAGPLQASQFVNGTAALDADDRILYDAASGVLSYDPDGNGVTAAIQFATISNHAALNAGEFLII